MAEAALFAQSLLIGLSIAAPVGPIGLLVIQRTLQRGALVGLATGLGAAVADALYGAVGAFGVSWVIDALVGARVPLALGGGAFLLWLAWRIWRSKPAETGGAGRRRRRVAVVFCRHLRADAVEPGDDLLLHRRVRHARCAAAGQLAVDHDRRRAGRLGAVVAAAQRAVGRLRSRFDARAQAWVNRASALLLAGFALWQWAGLLGH